MDVGIPEAWMVASGSRRRGRGSRRRSRARHHGRSGALPSSAVGGPKEHTSYVVFVQSLHAAAIILAVTDDACCVASSIWLDGSTAEIWSVRRLKTPQKRLLAKKRRRRFPPFFAGNLQGTKPTRQGNGQRAANEIAGSSKCRQSAVVDPSLIALSLVLARLEERIELLLCLARQKRARNSNLIPSVR